MKYKGLMCLILFLWILLLLISLCSGASIFFLSFTLSWLFVFSMTGFGTVSFVSLFISAVVLLKFWSAVYKGLGKSKKSFVLTLVYFIGSWLDYLIIYSNKSVNEAWGWIEILNIAAGVTISLLVLSGVLACSQKRKERYYPVCRGSDPSGVVVVVGVRQAKLGMDY